LFITNYLLFLREVSTQSEIHIKKMKRHQLVINLENYIKQHRKSNKRNKPNFLYCNALLSEISPMNQKKKEACSKQRCYDGKIDHAQYFLLLPASLLFAGCFFQRELGHQMAAKTADHGAVISKWPFSAPCTYLCSSKLD
jgi:hypothetical protein